MVVAVGSRRTFACAVATLAHLARVKVSLNVAVECARAAVKKVAVVKVVQIGVGKGAGRDATRNIHVVAVGLTSVVA